MQKLRTLEIEVDGEFLKVDIPPARRGYQSCFLFGVHKSGSTLLNRMVGDACAVAGIPVIDFPSAYFRAGVSIDKPENARAAAPYLASEGYVYGGARTFWCMDLGFDFSSVKKVFLLRDPRDAIISWFFSDKLSHGIPEKHRDFRALRDRLQAEKDVNDAVSYLQSRARALNTLATRYAQIMNDGNSVVYRYEDVIFRKRLWLADMCGFLDIDLPLSEIEAIADRHDLRPDSEAAGNFVRQVSPGNHLKHFSADTIGMLDEQLAFYLDEFGYRKIDRYLG